MRSLEKSIFKRGSTTYYFSSKFFPKEIRREVFKLYSFVRVADDYVDVVPQNKKEFTILEGLWHEASSNTNFSTQPHQTDSLNERVVKNQLDVSRKYDFETEWTDSFLASMRADLNSRQYATLDGSLWYVYGSAEVIGFMMAKILDLPEEALQYAAMQGRAMQWINFIRDIAEDNKLGRCYFPEEDLAKFGLKDLSEQTARTNTEAFGQFIEYQITRYAEWQTEANQGMALIPKRLRIPLQTAVDMYEWTVQQIIKNPLVIYDKKVRPKRTRILKTGIKKLV